MPFNFCLCFITLYFRSFSLSSSSFKSCLLFFVYFLNLLDTEFSLGFYAFVGAMHPEVFLINVLNELRFPGGTVAFFWTRAACVFRRRLFSGHGRVLFRRRLFSGRGLPSGLELPSGRGLAPGLGRVLPSGLGISSLMGVPEAFVSANLTLRTFEGRGELCSSMSLPCSRRIAVSDTYEHKVALYWESVNLPLLVPS
jgi:hypothetical protein